MNEQEVLDLLARRYDTRAGNGPRYVYAEHVRNGTGFYGYSDDYLTRRRCIGQVRTADAVAIDGWESKGHEIHGHEVKVSRSDWLHELAQPEKADAWKRWCNRWWLVVSDQAIVRSGELPAGWGLLAVRGSSVAVVTPAPRLEAEPMPLPVQIGLMRSVGKTAADRLYREVSQREAVA